MPKNKGKYRAQQTEAAPEEQLRTLTQRGVDAIRPHATKIAALVVGVAVVLGGFSVYSYFQNKKSEKATESFAKVMAETGRPVEGDLPTMQHRQNPDAKKFASRKERSEAALKELQALKAGHGSSSVGQQSLLVEGALAYDLGKYDEAIASYEQYLKSGTKVRELVTLAREGLGYALEGKALALPATDSGRQAALAKALTAYGEIDQDPKSPGYAQAAYHQGRVTALMGDEKGALALFKKAQDANPPMGLREELNARITGLEAKLGPATPAPSPTSAPASAPASQPAK